MKRFLIPILLCITLFLPSCGKNRGEGDYRAFAERLNRLDTLSFTAQVRAELITDGRVTVFVELSDWTENGAAPA